MNNLIIFLIIYFVANLLIYMMMYNLPAMEKGDRIERIFKRIMVLLFGVPLVILMLIVTFILSIVN